MRRIRKEIGWCSAAFLLLCVIVGNVHAAGTNDYVFDIDKNGKLIGFSCGSIDEIDVIVPYGVKSIGSECFSAAATYRLRSVTLPETVTTIENYAFARGVRYLLIPPSVTGIAPGALYDVMDNSLKNVIFIFCEQGSGAHRYAVEHGFAFSHDFPDYSIQNNPAVRQIPVTRTTVTSGFSNVKDNAYDFTTVPDIQTFISADGSVSVFDAPNATVYEFSPEMELLRTQVFSRELEQAGAFTKDSQGCYYIFYAQEAAEGAFNEVNMALVKYAPDGTKMLVTRHKAQTDDERWAPGYSGVKVPFRSGTCRLEISGDMIAVYFARQQFAAPDGSNHQGSYGFVWDLHTLERLTGKNGSQITMPSASHSFNQFILPIENGFVFVDHGDANPRAFAFEKVVRGKRNQQIASFRFPGGVGENYTGAAMGELAKTENGYLFCGSYNQFEGDAPYNLFLLTINEALTYVSEPIYLTHHNAQYSRYWTESLFAPKLVRIDDDQYLVLWHERVWDFDSEGPWGYRTFMSVVNGEGKVLQPTQELRGVDLQLYDVTRYNPVTKKVVWARVVRGVGNVAGDSILIYSLDPFTAPHYAPPEPPPTPQTATSSRSTVYVNGTAKQFEAYMIKGENYFRLRDIAYVLNGTNKQFSTGYNDATKAITLISGQPYTPVGQEMVQGDGKAKKATPNTSINMTYNGEKIQAKAYLINGSNYIKLRDLMRLLDICVTYDPATRNISIDTSLPYST